MKWKSRECNNAYRTFAILPVAIGETTVWLEWYWRRFEGTHFSVWLTEPNIDTAMREGGGE